MGQISLINGVLFTEQKIIAHPKGDILHFLKKDEDAYNGFGEVYFSKVKYNNIKAWKKHYKMTCNFVVPHGKIKVVIFDDRIGSSTLNFVNEFTLSPNNYHRLTVPNNVWYGFQGLDDDENILVNFANITHDAEEQINNDLNKIKYNWKI